MNIGRRPEEAAGKIAEKEAEKKAKRKQNGGLRKRNRYFVWQLGFF